MPYNVIATNSVTNHHIYVIKATTQIWSNQQETQLGRMTHWS